MKKIIPFVTGILLVGSMACKDEEIAFDPSVDAFIITKTVETESEVDTLYGLALHAFANKHMQTVTASPANDPDMTFELEAYDGYPYDFYFQTADDDFSSEMPFIGNYTFDILAQSGESETLSNELDEEIIYPTDTLKAVYDTEDDKMEVSWNEIDDADYIIVKMFDDDDELMFSAKAIEGNKTALAFDETTSGWVNGKNPVDGETYMIELDAYLFEPGQSEFYLQAKSINLKNVTWGE